MTTGNLIIKKLVNDPMIFVLRFIFINYACVCACMWACDVHMSTGANWGQMCLTEHLELELQTVMSYMAWVLRIELEPSGRTTTACN